MPVGSACTATGKVSTLHTKDSMTHLLPKPSTPSTNLIYNSQASEYTVGQRRIALLHRIPTTNNSNSIFI